MVMVLATDHRWVRILAPLAYLAAVGGLVLVLVNGTTINGSRSWIQLGGMSVQPAEIAKLAVVVGMALLVAERAEGRRGRPAGWADVAGMLVIAGIPAALILLQPDLGTMLVLSATVFGVIAASGGAAPLAAAALRRGRDRRGGRGVGGGAQAVPGRPVHGVHQPRPRPAAPATTPSRHGSRSATAGSSARGSSTARRPARASCPSSTPTSSSPSPARSWGWSAPGC